MKKQYIKPELIVIETDSIEDVLLVTSPGPGYGGPDTGSGSAESKFRNWGWEELEDW